MNQDKPYLRYVFDVADTGVRRSSPSITPWRVTDENRRFIMDEMERVFQVPSEGILEYQLENIAINLAREYWDDFKKPILDIVADSFLEEYDEYNIEVAFRPQWQIVSPMRCTAVLPRIRITILSMKIFKMYSTLIPVRR